MQILYEFGKLWNFRMNVYRHISRGSGNSTSGGDSGSAEIIATLVVVAAVVVVVKTQ